MKIKQRQFKDLGQCKFCGEPVREFASGWGCTGTGCGSFIFRDDKFFSQVLGHRMNKSYAKSLLTGSTVTFYKVDIHGELHDVEIGLGFDRSGKYKYRYTMNYLDYDKKKDKKEKQLTGFDLLNGD